MSFPGQKPHNSIKFLTFSSSHRVPLSRASVFTQNPINHHPSSGHFISGMWSPIPPISSLVDLVDLEGGRDESDVGIMGKSPSSRMAINSEVD